MSEMETGKVWKRVCSLLMRLAEINDGFLWGRQGSPLFHLRAMRVEDGPPLRVGRQLRWRKELQVLHPLPSVYFFPLPHLLLRAVAVLHEVLFWQIRC